MIKCSRCFTEQSGPMICVSCANDLADIGTKQVAALRQQRDELIEALLILYGAATAIHKQEAAWQGVFERTRAALASIEGDE